MSEGRCVTCKWWSDEATRSKPELRECDRIPQRWDAFEWDDDAGNWDDVLKPEFADIKAFAEDGSSYRAALVTAPDFGCVMWEAKG